MPRVRRRGLHRRGVPAEITLCGTFGVLQGPGIVARRIRDRSQAADCLERGLIDEANYIAVRDRLPEGQQCHE